MSVAAELIQILGDLQTITGLLQNLAGLNQQNATKADMLANFALTNQLISLNAQSLQNVLAQERQIWADLTRQIQGLGVQTGIPQQATQPVMLPATAPATFLDATNGGTAQAIWNYTDFRGLFTPFGIMYDLYNLIKGLSQSWALPTIGAPHFLISGPIEGNPIVSWPILALPSTDTILTTDGDVGAWLSRTASGFTWNLITPQQIWRAHYVGPPTFEIDCTLSESEFRWFQQANAGMIPGTLTRPVWPGIANVTYGVPQSMDAPNGSLTGPADGYKINIDAVPSWAGKFDFGAQNSWRNAGAIAFVNDEGVAEFPQTLGFEHVFYTPQSMAHSVGAYYRLSIGFHAVATPFTVNS